MDSPLQETLKELFKTIVLLVFYPFGCLIWIYLCHKHQVSGSKRFTVYAVGGYVSWALVILAFFVGKPWRLALDLAGSALYATVLVLFVKLSLAKVREIEQRQQARFPALVRDSK